MKSARSQTNEFDAQYLLETKEGTYGYGNAIWPKDYGNGASSSSGSDWMGGDPIVFEEKPWRPLTGK
jgi:cellulose synthase-like protein